jgi:pre-mRNA-splicing factor CWC22
MRDRQAQAPAQASKEPFDPKAEYERLMETRAGGTYVPPAKLRALQAAFSQKGTKEFQRIAWENLKKSINGLVNKANKANIKIIAPALFGENLIRGRGLFARSMMKAQAAALPFTPVYAAMVAIVNTKLPQVGELLLSRLIVQFRRAFKRNDKPVCLASVAFLAHLCNQQVAHEIVALQMLALLLERPTDDSVEIAVGFMREVGAFLAEVSPKANNGVFERFRSILHEAEIDRRVQYMVEVLFQVRKEKYKDHPILEPELDLVEEEDQITHYISLDDDLDIQDSLNVFQFDEHYDESEAKYAELKKEILGDDEEEESGEEDEDEDEENALEEERQLEIQDETNAKLTSLRRSIYLTIMSSVDYEECTHKLMKLKLQAGQEQELCNMIVECCSQERSYTRFYGLIAERFCKLNRRWRECFAAGFTTYYETVHRYETNKLRNIAKLFGHLLSEDGLSWDVLSCVHMNEGETTSSSRIFIKILFEELTAALGLKRLAEKCLQPDLQASLKGLFPKDGDAKKTRFAINYFTSIGLGLLTEDMRAYLLAMPKPTPARPMSPSDSGTSRSGSYTSRSYSSRSRSYSRSSRSRSYSRSSRSSSRSTGSSYSSRSSSRSRSPRRARRRHSSHSRSRSPRGRESYPVRRGRRRSSEASRDERRRSLSGFRNASRGRQGTADDPRGPYKHQESRRGQERDTKRS